MLVWMMAAALIVLLILLMMSYRANGKLKEEVRMLKEILEVREKTVENLQASRVAVKDVIENFSRHAEVMALVEEGKSIEEVAHALDLPTNKVELIIKFDKIKKDHGTL